MVSGTTVTSTHCTTGTDCASEDKCIEACANLPTAKYAVTTAGVVTPATLLNTLVDADNTGDSSGSEKYC